MHEASARDGCGFAPIRSRAGVGWRDHEWPEGHAEPVPLRRPTRPEGFLSDLKAAHEIQDDTFVAVGYGLLDGWPPPNLVTNEDRWYVTSPYGSLKKNNLHLQQNPVSTGQGGTCFGDSGGPHFWQDTLIIASVTSWGDAVCRSNDQTQRIDLPSVLDWLQEEFGVTPA